MSGIYGVVHCDGAPVTAEMLSPLAAAMSGWGFDGHGQWRGGAAGLGHAMLRETPESRHERQPASIRAAPHLVITADARIDNREELFDALQAPAAGREDTPDNSLILLAYERWGAGCAGRLLGDFSFAVWDARERRLFCARDPLGCKPFVFHYDGRKFLFASDVRGVVAGIAAPELNEPLLAAHLQRNTCYAQKEQTFFRNVFKLPPGHTLTLTAGGPKTERYWAPEDAPRLPRAGQGEYAEQLSFLFRQSVECRLRCSLPVGAHLSGGLDSSAIVIAAARAQRENNRALAAFSWSPAPESPEPDGEYQRIAAVCRQEQLRCEFLPVTAASLIRNFQRDFTTEPVAMMAREANVQEHAEARGIRVLLSGWGGDEAVTCRATTSPGALLRANGWRDFLRAMKWGLETPPDNAASLAVRARRLAGIFRAAAEVRYPDWLYGLTVADPYMMHAAPCLRPAKAREYRKETRILRGPALRRLPDVRGSICRLLDLGHVPLRMEHWAAAGAQHGIVYRYPMLDRRLVEFALGIPPSPLRGIDRRRSLFRDAVGEMLPSGADWNTAKEEASTVAALREAHLTAFAEWARRLGSENAAPVAAEFADPERIAKAVRSAAASGRVEGLSGVREAFGCYAIRSIGGKIR